MCSEDSWPSGLLETRFVCPVGGGLSSQSQFNGRHAISLINCIGAEEKGASFGMHHQYHSKYANFLYFANSHRGEEMKHVSNILAISLPNATRSIFCSEQSRVNTLWNMLLITLPKVGLRMRRLPYLHIT